MLQLQPKEENILHSFEIIVQTEMTNILATLLWVNFTFKLVREIPSSLPYVSPLKNQVTNMFPLYSIAHEVKHLADKI